MDGSIIFSFILGQHLLSLCKELGKQSRVSDLSGCLSFAAVFIGYVFVSLTPESFSNSTYWEHNFSVYNVYSRGELTKVQVTPYAQTLTFPLR